MLMAAYAYYQLNTSLVPDEVYDLWYKRLKRDWRLITHPHRHLIDVTSKGSSGAILLNDYNYPSVVKGATMEWIRRHER